MDMFWKNWRIWGGSRQAIKASQNDYRAVVVTDIGCMRKNNQDAALFVKPLDQRTQAEKGVLAIIADGMGGHEAGEVASSMVVEAVSKTYFTKGETEEEGLYISLRKANREIWTQAIKNKSLSGMGTTCTVVAIANSKIFLGHVGDSRAYLLRDSLLIQLSKDHTVVQELLDQGILTIEEAQKHPSRNLLTRAIGTHNKVRIDITALPYNFESADKLILCTDGLYEYLGNDEIVEILLGNPISQAAEKLVETAKQLGGNDNITVVIIETIEEENQKIIRQTRSIEIP